MKRMITTMARAVGWPAGAHLMARVAMTLLLLAMFLMPQTATAKDSRQDYESNYVGRDWYWGNSWNTVYDANNADGKYYVNSCRAYFHVALDGQANVRAFVLNFGDDEEQTATRTISANTPATADTWYTLNGVPLNGKPTARGIYINNGKKVVIK